VGAVGAGSLPERPIPGGRWGGYPQRDETRLRGGLHALLGRLRALDGRRSRRFALAVLERAGALASAGAPLPTLVASVRRRLAAGGAGRAARIDALALACLAARRSLGLDPYPTQVHAAAVMLDDGLAELATGEGKTLALALAAAARALAGVPVHVVSANEYLVERDCEALAPFYRALGLSCDRVLAADPPARRRQAWRRDVTYCSAHELMFDWLRDRLAGADRADLGTLAASLRADGAPPPAPLLRGLCCAFVDEADGLLVDQAVLPCVLAQSDDDPADACAAALRIAAGLWQGRDWRAEPGGRSATLTDAGRERVAAAAAREPGGAWRIARRREALVAQAIAALHLYRIDRDYLLTAGRIEIVDPATGRVATGRAWSDGLHQMIEHKERAAGTLPHRPVIQATPAQHFRRYWRLGGLSATLAEAGTELAAGYGTAVVRIAPRAPSQRIDLGLRLFPDRATQQAAVVARVAALAAAGRPVLVAVRDVAESAALAAAMRAAGLAPAIIDARHAEGERDAVAGAGVAGTITLATDMAGRGTDIVLDGRAIAAGGLALVATHLHASRRLQRQLAGRVARRGEPGSAELWLDRSAPMATAAARPQLPPFVGRLPAGVQSLVAGAWLRAVQSRMASRERRHRRRLRDAADQRGRRHFIGRIED
jgi:preprotein translocase subunit SecA